jgi:hypothetical protein
MTHIVSYIFYDFVGGDFRACVSCHFFHFNPLFYWCIFRHAFALYCSLLAMCFLNFIIGDAHSAIISKRYTHSWFIVSHILYLYIFFIFLVCNNFHIFRAKARGTLKQNRRTFWHNFVSKLTCHTLMNSLQSSLIHGLWRSLE